MAITTTAIILWLKYPFFFFKAFRKDTFFEGEHDFETILESGQKLTKNQGIEYHYFNSSGKRGFLRSFIVNIKDFLLAVLGIIPWTIFNLIYWPYKISAWIFSPISRIWRYLTPWEEKEYETLLLWWSKAIDEGIESEFPDYIYLNTFSRFMIPRAVSSMMIDIMEV